MIRDASGHRRGGPAPGVGQTRMRWTAMLDRPDQRQAMLQRQRAPRPRPASARPRRPPRTDRRVPSCDVRRVDHPDALRAAPQRLDARRCPVTHTPLARDDAPLGRALHDLGEADVAPGA
jgi:hypothetical protein